jgi:hypothetical protein
MGQIFRRAEQYLDKIDAGIFVEIGSSRDGDDGSTKVIAGWAKQRDCWLMTVDFDPRVSEALKKQFIRVADAVGTGQPPDDVDIITATGEEYLKWYSERYSHGDDMEPISLLYLDNFDWDWHPMNTEDFVLEQQQRYDELGYHMTNLTSQMAHLNQAILAMPYMALRSLIVCDDTWYNEHWGHYSGKSGAAVPYLIGQGYRVLETEENPVYGTILGRW